MITFAGTFRRGVAVAGLGVYLKDKATGAPVITGTATGYITIDNGDMNPISVAPAHKDRGFWTFGLSIPEMTGTKISGQIEHPDADPVPFVISTDSADIGAIADDSTAATNLAAGARGLVPFTVGASPTATTIPTGLTGLPYTNPNHFEGALAVINGERRTIYGSSGSPVVLTTDAFNSVPSQNDPGVIS